MPSDIPKILLLEDLESDVELMKRELHKSHQAYEILVVNNAKDYSKALAEFMPDIILADHSIPSFNSLEALMLASGSDVKIPFILVTGTLSEEYAIDIIKNGASDYILKDRIQRLPSAITNALEKSRLEAERKAYLDEIIANESLLRATEKLAHIGSWQADLLTGTTKWSDEVYRIFGLSPGKIAPALDSFLKFVHPEDINIVKDIIKETTYDKDNAKFDYRIIDNNNNLKYIHTELYVDRDIKGMPFLITGFDQDITEYKITQELLIASEHRYKRVVENIMDALIIDNNDGEVIFANEQFLKLFGLNADDLDGLKLEDYFAPSYRQELRDRHDRRMKGEDVPNIFEYEGARKDGTQMWIEVRVSKIIENNKIVGSQSAIRDITERKKTEKELLKSQANLNAIFNNTDISFILTDNKLNIISFNQVAESGFINIMKMPLMEGHSILDYFEKQRKEEVLANYAKVLKGEHISYETNYPHPNGTLIWYDVQLSPVPGPGHEVLGMLMSLTYITDWKNAQQEREKLTSDLILRNQDLEQFTYIVSHNLRGPVANILGSANLLASKDLSEFEQDFILKGITISINKLDSVILDLNEILQLKHSVLDNKERVFFSEIFTDVTEIINILVQKEDVCFETDFAEADMIYSIKSYIHSIFYNLISNSIKYKKPGSQPLITIKSYQLSDTIKIIFSDNGLGFDLKKIGNQVFGLYKKFHFHSDGKGMGLFMVKTQLEALGATIEIESEINEGTKFIINFKQ